MLKAKNFSSINVNALLSSYVLLSKYVLLFCQLVFVRLSQKKRGVSVQVNNLILEVEKLETTRESDTTRHEISRLRIEG